MPKYIQVGKDVVEFPDEMSDSEIESVLSDGNSGPPKQKESPPASFQVNSFGDYMKALGGLGEIGLSGATGFLSQIPAGLYGIGAGIVPGGKTGAEAVESTKDALTYRPRSIPGQVLAQGIGEAAEPVAQLGRKIEDITETPYPLLNTFMKTAALGGLEIGGLAAGGLGATAKAAPGSFVPSIKDLYGAGRVAFNEARINGGGIKPEAISRLRRGTSNFRNEAGVRIDFDPDLHGPAVRVQTLINEAIDNPSGVDFDRLLSLRELAGDVAGNSDPAISFRGVLLKNQIDEFVDSLRPSDVISGNPERAARSLETARNLWRDASKARTIEREIELAGNRAGQFSGSGYENALRTQFRQLNARIIKGQEKGWTQAERRAIARVANGGSMDNVWRFLGKFAPTGVVSSGIGAGLGYTAFGPIGAAVVPASGALGRLFASRGTIGNAQAAMDLPLKRSLLEM